MMVRPGRMLLSATGLTKGANGAGRYGTLLSRWRGVQTGEYSAERQTQVGTLNVSVPNGTSEGWHTMDMVKLEI